MNKIDNLEMKQLKKSLTTIIVIIAIIAIVGIMVSCTVKTTTERNNTTGIEIEGILNYNDITIREGSISNVSPNWANRVAGQTVIYSISVRPSGATAENVAIDSASGVISVSNRAIASDSGEYTIIVTGTGNYGGTITATIQITVNGRDWLQLTDNAGFIARQNHTSVVLGSEMYVIGGDSGGVTNDVWKSSDGNAWTEATTPTSIRFPTRRSHTSVVLGGEIYVIGGDSGGQTNDVWKSSDGGTWTEATTPTSTRFPVRRSHTSVVLGSEIYVIGGTGAGNSSLNDVWKSSDGRDWLQVTTTTTSTLFPVRSSHTSVVLGSEIYVIGGSSGGDDVWKSSDGGTNWTEVTPTASTLFTARSTHTSVVLGDEMYVIGGVGIDSSSLNDVWKSSDGGTNWTQFTIPTQFPIRFAHTSVVLGGEIYVMGGLASSGRLNDVWVFRYR